MDNTRPTFVREIYHVSLEDKLVIEWDGEQRTIKTYTRGTTDPMYSGNSLDAAADSLEVSREDLDCAMMSDCEEDCQ